LGLGERILCLHLKKKAMRKLAIVVLPWSVVPTTLAASQVEESWANLKQLQPGEKIEVTDTNLKVQNGTLLSVSEEAISFRTRKAEVNIARPDVLRVRSSGGSHRTRWTLIGMGMGAAAGAAIGCAGTK